MQAVGGVVKYQCKACMHRRYLLTKEKHRAVRNATAKAWRITNLDKSKAQNAQYRIDHAEHLKDYKAQRRRDRRMTVLRHYSSDVPSCACCGESIIEFLVIDHVHGGGGKHRKEPSVGGGSAFVDWLIKNSFPIGFRVLCHNCNAAVVSGPCPHACVVSAELQQCEDGPV